MKTIFVFLFLFFTASCVFAQQPVTGFVRDATTGEGLIGAIVVVDNGKYQYRARYPQRQARNINDGVGKRSRNISDGDLEIISEHSKALNIFFLSDNRAISPLNF